MSRALLFVLAAALAGCATPSRIDQANVREIRSGTSVELSVIVDHVTGMTCYKSSTGLWCGSIGGK